MRNPFLDDVKAQNIEAVRNNITKDLLLSTDSYGDSALHIAVLKKNMEMVRFFIENGVDVNLCNKQGKTALHYAAESNLLEIARYIIAHNGKVDISDQWNNEPLWTATFNYKGFKDRLEIVELFLKNGGHKEHKNNAGRSPVDFANQVGFPELTELLSNYK